MAIIYSTKTSQTIGTPFYRIFEFDRYGTTQDGYQVTFYGGTQPSADDFYSNWATIYRKTSTSPGANPPLLHLQRAGISISTLDSNSCVIYNTALSDAQPAYASGTITWAVWWATYAYEDIFTADLESTNFPSDNRPSFVLVPASDMSGSGVFKFTNPTVVAGTSYTYSSIELIFSVTGAL